MIQLPRRSVTRFFVPLIDVLTLLFCIFLLMPMVKPSGETGMSQIASLEAQLRTTQEELEKQRKEGGATENLQNELKRLREEKIKTLQQRLQVRVLEIDPNTGKLYYNAPERLEIRGEADARELIEKDQRNQGSDRRELYYLILFPRDPASPYPLRGQREQYDRWLAEVAHGWDIPGAARGGTP
jgi:hypothetical protein